MPGAKQVFYGICLLLVVIVALPDGVWPWLARRTRPDGARAMSALLSVDGVSKRFRGLRRGRPASASRCRRATIFAVIGPNGAGKTTLFNMIAGVFAPDGGAIAFAGERIDGLPPDAVCRRGIGRTFQIVRPFPALTRRGQRHRRRAAAPPARRATRARHAHEVLRRLDLLRQARRSAPRR